MTKLKLVKVYIAEPSNHPYGEVEIHQRAFEEALEGFTRYRIAGGWQGKLEPGYVYEVIVTSWTKLSVVDIEGLATELGRAWGQQEVLVTTQEIDAEFLSCGNKG